MLKDELQHLALKQKTLRRCANKFRADTQPSCDTLPANPPGSNGLCKAAEGNGSVRPWLADVPFDILKSGGSERRPLKAGTAMKSAQSPSSWPVQRLQSSRTVSNHSGPTNFTSIWLALGLAIVFALSLPCSGAVLLDDDWDDGDRTDTNLPEESAWYANNTGTPATPTLSVAVGSLTGNVRMFETNTSSRLWITHFTPAGSPVELGLKDLLKITLVFTPSNAA